MHIPFFLSSSVSFVVSCRTCAEIRLQVEEMESNVTVEESKSIRLGCSIPSQSSRDSRFSVSWYVEHFEDMDDDDQPGEEDRKQECVFSIGHDAVFGNGNCSPRDHGGPNSRLQFERMTSDQYSLTIQGALPTDSGRYYCHVEEWLLNPRNAWYRLTTNNSGFTIVNVLPQGKTLIPHLTFSQFGCLINLDLSSSPERTTATSLYPCYVFHCYRRA